MRPRRDKLGVFACALGVQVMLLLSAAGSALASVTVRFVHAVPGAGAAQVKVSADGSHGTTTTTSFGNVSRPLEVRSGQATFVLEAPGGGRTLARLTDTVADGARYTLVAIAKKGGASLSLYEDGQPRGGKALFRAIHANPELGTPDIKVGDRVVAEGLEYGKATDYASLPPGTYDVAVTRPGGKGAPIATKKGVPLTAGSMTTAIVVGSRGQPTRIITLSDGTAAPPGAPQTGGGALAGGGHQPPSRWLVGVLAALVAGTLGAGAWALAGRR